jgi:hypothetical protein
VALAGWRSHRPAGCVARSAHGRVGRGSAHDTPDLLALYMPEGSPLRFAADFFGARHPWSYTDRWRGHRCSSCSAPEMRSVLVFWAGEKRTFAGWYVNLQEPFLRTWLGIDTQRPRDRHCRFTGRLMAVQRTTSRWSNGFGADVGRLPRSPRSGPRQIESATCSKTVAVGGKTSGSTGSRTLLGQSRRCQRAGVSVERRVGSERPRPRAASRASRGRAPAAGGLARRPAGA